MPYLTPQEIFERALLEAEEVSDEDLQAASDMFDRLIAGTLYPPEGTKVGPYTIHYAPGQKEDSNV